MPITNRRAAYNNHVSDFLGRIFFPCPNELNFCMWPSTSEKNIPPYLSLLVSLSFSRNNVHVCKNAVFFLGPVVQKLVNANLGLKVNQGFCFSC